MVLRMEQQGVDRIQDAAKRYLARVDGPCKPGEALSLTLSPDALHQLCNDPVLADPVSVRQDLLGTFSRPCLDGFYLANPVGRFRPRWRRCMKLIS